MRTQRHPAPPSARRSRAALLALFAVAFVAGSAELVVVGVLTLVAEDLSVSVAAAGALVAAYAAGIALGGPVLSSVTLTAPRRWLLVGAFAAYVVGNAGAALVGSFALLVAARALTGALHGLVIGTALGVAATLVPPERTGRAIAMVLGGIATSTAIGVPVGTLIGQQAGWRTTFGTIAVAGAVVLVVAAFVVPATRTAGAQRLGVQAGHAFAPRVLLVLTAGFLVMGAQFTALTFVTPFLEDVTGLASSTVTVFLFVYGLAAAVGTLLGGRAADANPNRTLVVATVVVLAALLMLALGGGSRPVVVVALVVWGLAGWGLVPSLQYRTVALAGEGRDLAATLPASATTGGIALGSVLGGWALERYGATGPAVAAALGCAAVLPLVVLTTRLRPPPAEPVPSGLTARATSHHV